MSTHFASKIIDAKCVDMVHTDAFCNKNIDAFSVDLVYIEAKSNSKKTLPFSIWAATHNVAKRLIVLVVFKLNVPVNSFSVMSGRRHRLCFLGDGVVEPPRVPE